MMDWVQKKLTKEWTVYYLPEDKKDTVTWLMEHTVPGCGGTVEFDNDHKKCSLCKTELPSKLQVVMTCFLNKDLIKL